MNCQDYANKFPFHNTAIQIKIDNAKIRSNNCISIFANAGTATRVNFPFHNGKLFNKTLLLVNVRYEQITQQR